MLKKLLINLLLDTFFEYLLKVMLERVKDTNSDVDDKIVKVLIEEGQDIKAALRKCKC